MKNNDQNIESLMTAKLTDLYKLQNSISLLTEQVYKEKMTVFKSHKKEIPNIYNKTITKDKISELLTNISQIVLQNSQYIDALKQNLLQIKNKLKPNIDNTIKLLKFVEKKIQQRFSSDFIEAKEGICDEFFEILEYISTFSELLEEFCGSETRFQRFQNYFSYNQSINQKEPIKKENTIIETPNQVLEPEILIQIIKDELLSDKNSIKDLANIIELVEREKNMIETRFFNPSEKCKCIQKLSDSKLNNILTIINDLLKILKNAMITRENRIK